jgi:CMP-N-acetylneuraminic acid synthetase|tara:strand:- start:4086 stop:4748 length:663 start_codon:yes stop_codon:yes gene_type:complete
MSRKKITAVIPIRKGSQRVPDKNFKDFYRGKSLLQLKIESLKQVPLIDEIIVNTDSTDAISIAKSNNVSWFKRGDYYASSDCTNTEHWYNIAKTTHTDLIMHVPCTAPCIEPKTYYDLINRFILSSHDSANTVALVKEYLWLNNKPLNYNINKVQNSQDLPDVMKLTFGISILSRDTMLKRKNVVGDNPMFYIVSDEESIDIDTPLDFEFAKHIYKIRNR